MSIADLRIGQGQDTHRVISGRRLVLGGVSVDSVDFGLDGHSDADVLLHAITDALLGAAGLGDIGEHFPNTDDQWKDADSGKLLQAVMQDVAEHGWRIVNLDCTIHAERPKLTAWKPVIRRQISNLLNLPEERVNVKAKSGENVGPVGQGQAICADAVVLLQRRSVA